MKNVAFTCIKVLPNTEPQTDNAGLCMVFLPMEKQLVYFFKMQSRIYTLLSWFFLPELVHFSPGENE